MVEGGAAGFTVTAAVLREAGAAAGIEATVGDPEVSNVNKGAPTATVSFTAAWYAFRVPATGDRTSTLT